MIQQKMLPSLMGLSLCVLFAGFTLALPKSSFSAIENRTLSKTPGFSHYSFNRQHVAQLEHFLHDHAYARIALTRFDHLRQQLSGITKIDGIYRLPNRLIQSHTTTSTPLAHQNTHSINRFVKQDHHQSIPIFLSLIPSASEIYQNLLDSDPTRLQQARWIHSLYPAETEEESSAIKSAKESKPSYNRSTPYGVFEQIHPIDSVTPLLRNKQDKLFYYSDNQLTTLGHYIVYYNLMFMMGKIPISQDLFHIEHLQQPYLGDLYAQALTKPIFADHLSLYHYAPQVVSHEVTRFSGLSKTVSSSLYDRQFLTGTQQLHVFLGENVGITRITTQQDSSEKLLLFGDSSIKPILPFLSLHYKEILFVNLQYLTKEQQGLIVSENYDSMLFLYSFPFYMKNSSISMKLPWLF